MEYLAGNLEIENNPYEISIWDSLVKILDAQEGILGYKIPSLGFRENQDVPSFIIRSSIQGLILIDVVSDKIESFDEENEYWETGSNIFIFSKDIALTQYAQELEDKLRKSKQLFDIRSGNWKVDIAIKKILIFHDNTQAEIDSLNAKTDNPIINKYIGSDKINLELEEFLKSNNNAFDAAIIDTIDSILDGSDVFSKTKKKKVVEEPTNIHDYIKKSLDYTFKLDKIQRQVALQVPPGPQRIRGLAGTGKTVILCMKAALAHKAFPDLKILFVFNTQSMYNQVRSAITEYYLNEAKTTPNWDKLHIYHAWGGSNKNGVYYNTANSVGIKPKVYFNVKGSDNPLEAIYTDLLQIAKEKIIPQYDIVLIDEAQDFNPAFFETIFYLTKPVDGDNEKKRIIWAYDEFQSLTELNISQPEELFGKDKNGKVNMPNSVLEGVYKGNIEKDFVLPNSYRNPRINLMVAHGLALGIYSNYGKVPMEDSRDWIARGYTIREPQKAIFNEGDQVIVERPESFSKNILERLLKEYGGEEKRLITFKKFTDAAQQLNEVVNKIEWLITKQKVEPEEILVINLDTRNSKIQYESIRQQLDMRGIKSITPGYIESSDSFKELGYVTLSTTFRAKGNETNIVFLLNSQQIITDATFRMRNAAFVSITRSRGWCYLYGYGQYVEDLDVEIQKIISDYPFFKFRFPNEEEIKRKITIIKSTKDVEKADKEIDKLLSEEAYRALLIEKLMHDPDMVKAIQQIKSKDEGHKS